MVLFLAATLSSVGGCGSGDLAVVRGTVRRGRDGAPLANATVTGSHRTEVRTDRAGRFLLRIPGNADPTITVIAAGYCPVTAQATAAPAGQPRPEVLVNMFPRLEARTGFVQVGFGTETVIEAKTRCDPDAVLRWTQTSGPPLDDALLRVEAGGRKVTVRTHVLGDLAALDSRPGVVALSRAERGDYRFALEAELGGQVARETVRVVAAPAAPGVFQVPTSSDVYLNGGETGPFAWELTVKPEGSRAAILEVDGRIAHLRPDVFGEYIVKLGSASRPEISLSLQAGPYEDIPRDCGRDACHRGEDDGWQTTLHATTFVRGLDGALGPDFDARCWACHATGVEPGVRNGGLHETAEKLGWRQPAPAPGVFGAAPRGIRRHGAVWCSACHGPGRILRPQFHWEYGAKYQVGVCARCHDGVDDPDSPHDSWQVREWRAAPMAVLRGGRGTGAPSRRRECTGCHSAQGFVGWVMRTAVLPDEQTLEPVTCAACHDPHSGANPRSMRVGGRVDWVSGRPADGLGTGGVCATCHRSRLEGNDATRAAPHAPQADVLLGRGSVLLSPRAMQELPAPHASIANTCVACHMAQPETAEFRGRLGGHTFSVRDLQVPATAETHLNARACSDCHNEGVPTQAIGGIRDWDRDGRADNIGQEFSRTVLRLRERIDRRVALAHVYDHCSPQNLAAGFSEVEAALVLRRSDGRLLGDCDGDGVVRAPEVRVTVAQLSKRLRALVWDLSLLVKDGSRGRHNPPFAFAVLRELESALD